MDVGVVDGYIEGGVIMRIDNIIGLSIDRGVGAEDCGSFDCIVSIFKV